MTTAAPRPRVGEAAWRRQAERLQELAVPASGRTLLSCSAPLGVGGLGRHLEEIAGALQRRGDASAGVTVICGSAERSASRARGDLRAAALTRGLKPLVRFSPAWRLWLTSVSFDADAARRAPVADQLITFNGTALAQFRAARARQTESIALVSATAHMRHVLAQQARACRQYPLERPWASRVLTRNLREYALAERIYVSSNYIRESFAREGFPEEKLAHFPLTPDARFQPPPERPAGPAFAIAYVGGLTVDKGVPLLLEAFARLPHDDMRLLLVGGWKTRSMRRHVQSACARDARVELVRGDPLPALQRARLCVHASYSDGFGYAAAEAMACGVPVLVSANTGMKDLIDAGTNGLVLPSGDVDAWTDAIDAAYRGELFTR